MTRRTFAGATVLALAGALAACTDDGDGGGIGVDLVADPPATAVLPGDELTATSVALSAALYASADAAIVTPEADLDAFLSLLDGQSLPLPLLIGTGGAVGEELDRLGAGTLITSAGTDLGDLAGDREITEIDLTAEEPGLPDVEGDGHQVPVALFLDPDQEVPAQGLATAVITAVGGTVAEAPGGDVGRTSDSVAVVRDAATEDPTHGVLALGDTFGGSDVFPSVVSRVTTTTSELPGGGITAFPGRRMIAAYGTPHTPSLGILGEQGLEETIERVKQMAADYEEFSDEQVIPAFEIITTVASAAAGADGDYSTELGIDGLREWVDAAGEAGVYVVLDLQPGTTHFLDQAKKYEELLLNPHVGLALDPEWRLKPGQRHMVQIGSVPAAEINEVITWLADLTAQNGLPQKVLILHQFNLRMISDRQDVDTSRPELAITLHADGHGNPGDKMATWEALQRDLPGGIFMAWKNFIDEDTPMFTPEETYALEPRPWFVSYQ
ncbi:hypothetical protein [Brachybacterium aquaticum]|uniref:hypothetical protein n=1 Tax=Brachybacterium aquaticum TaxID=1432564 RepID=UPI0028ABAA8A|nr:hypothetical protein [Brachybacterium aquaticum]